VCVSLFYMSFIPDIKYIRSKLHVSTAEDVLRNVCRVSFKVYVIV